MVMFKKKEPWVKPFPKNIVSRLTKISTGDLPLWADTTGLDLGRYLREYEDTRNIIYLTEALNHAEVLHALVDEYHHRMTSTK